MATLKQTGSTVNGAARPRSPLLRPFNTFPYVNVSNILLYISRLMLTRHLQICESAQNDRAYYLVPVSL